MELTPTTPETPCLANCPKITPPLSDAGDHHAAIREQLDQLIGSRNITTLFQPIYDLRSNDLLGYEALSRGPEKSLIHLPEPMFSAARLCGRLAELDCLCREKAIENFKAAGLSGKLTINVDPCVLIDPSFRQGRTLQTLSQAGIPSEQVILELTEQTRTDHYENLKQAVIYYRRMGFSLALDDLGAGYSNLRLLAELEPDYIKLDKYFVSQVDQNPAVRDFIRLIADLAHRVNCRIIAEGIESAPQLCFVRELGIDFAQGYLLGKPRVRPEHAPPLVLLETMKKPLGFSVASSATAIDDMTEETVKSLNLQTIPPCSSGTLLKEVLKRFKNNPMLAAIPVIDGHEISGLLMRDAVMQAFASQFGHELNRRTTAAQKMDRFPLVVSIDDKLTDVSQKVTNRAFDMVYAPLIVRSEEGYAGLLSVQELLENITRNQLSYARYCNPLTGLPGNISIQREVTRLLDERIHFVFCHLDLDHFKAFNDYYGYERGDAMIRMVAETLTEHALSGDFIGHIGGDDFVYISSQASWKECLEGFLDALRIRFSELYDPRDWEAGYLETENRNGKMQRFPLASMSIGALPCWPGRFSSHLEVSEAVSELKHLAKRQPGNTLFVDRRRQSSA